VPTPPPDILRHEGRLARRIERMFRLERRGILERRSRDLKDRLAARRGDLIAALIRTDATRHTLKLAVSPELHAELTSLWREVQDARQGVDVRLMQLETELRLSSGAGIASGVRDSGSSRLIGRG
jgi:hypothetical protein